MTRWNRFLARSRREDGFMMGYLVITLLLAIVIGSLTRLVSQDLLVCRKRHQMVKAVNFAEGGVSAACYDMQKALKACNGSTTNFVAMLCSNSPTAYTTNKTLTTSDMFVCERTITNLYTQQSVTVQLQITNTMSASKVQVVSSAKVGTSTQTVRPMVSMRFSGGAVIISDAQGTADTSSSKGIAKKGNVCINGQNDYNSKASKYGPTVIDGTVMANGAVNADAANITLIQQHLWGTPDQIVDYTLPGNPYQLFDFNRFVKCADKTPGTNHFTKAGDFITAAKSGAVLEGVVVVDMVSGDGNNNKFDTKTFPNGINIRGTLVFRFVPANKWSITDKITMTASLNINPANLTGLNPKDPTTFLSGYPPTYSSPSKNPINVHLGPGYTDFKAGDDLPALMYDNAIMDFHGACNISGVLYTPAFVEIENHGSMQYIKGTIISGGGVFIDNNGNGSANIVSFDKFATDNLVTAGANGKAVHLDYWAR